MPRPALAILIAACAASALLWSLVPGSALADGGYVPPVDYPFDRLAPALLLEGPEGFGEVLEVPLLDTDITPVPDISWDYKATFRDYRPHYGSASHGHASCSYYHSTANPNWPYSSSWGTSCHPTRYYYLASSFTAKGAGWVDAAVEAFKNWDLPDTCTPHWVRTTDSTKAHVTVRIASTSNCAGAGTSWYACAWSGWSITLNSAIGFGLGVSGKVDVESILTVELAHVVHFAHSPSFADSISQANMGIWGNSTVRVPSANSCGFSAYTACVPSGTCAYKDCPKASEGGCGSARRLRPGDFALAKHIAGTNPNPPHPYDDGTPPPTCNAVLNGAGASVVIDELAPGCFERVTSYWWDVSEGHDGHHYTTFASDKAAPETIGRWHFDVATGGRYRLEGWMPATEVSATKVKYIVHSGSASATSPAVDQTAAQGWVDLGTYDLVAGPADVQVNDNTGESLSLERKIAFDALRWTWVDPAAECASVGTTGACSDSVLGRCPDGYTYETTDCGAPSLCIWDDAGAAYRCAACADVPEARCDGALWVRCEADSVAVDDCGASGQLCSAAGCTSPVADDGADVASDTPSDAQPDTVMVLDDVPRPDPIDDGASRVDGEGDPSGASDASAGQNVATACGCRLASNQSDAGRHAPWLLALAGAMRARRRRRS